MLTVRIRRANALAGQIALPGDKSISHRAAMLAGIAEGETRITGYADGEDCRATLECLTALGVEIEQKEGRIVVRGVGKQGLRPAASPLDCGNSGTTIRLIAGILAGQPFDSVLTGDASLSTRPMRRIIEPLEQMGAVIDSMSERAPLTVHGRARLNAIGYRTPVASAQIKSCILLAGLNAEGMTSVIESAPTRDHTERMLRWFGVEVRTEKADDRSAVSVSGDSVLTARDIAVPGDISAAAFFMVAAACLPGSNIRLVNVGINPLRSAICGVLTDAGAVIEMSDKSEGSNEPVSTIEVRGGLSPNASIEINGERTAALIDEIPILAVLGTQLDRGLEVRDARELRVKESDRIAAIAENLTRMGASISEFDDGFRVERSELRGALITTHGDHRIAMAFAIAGLLADGETELDDPHCAAVSFPRFFDELENVRQ